MARPSIRRLDVAAGSADRDLPEIQARPSLQLGAKLVFGAFRDRMLVGLLAVSADGAFATVAASDHFVATDVDADLVYGELYREAAQTCLEAGAHIHDVEVLASSPAETAFFNLGFGRRTCIATRGVAFADSVPGPVVIRAATAADLDTIAALSALEGSHRTQSPILADHGPITADSARSYHERLLDAAATHLIAELGGEAVGLITIEWTNAFGGLLEPTMPLIGSTFVSADHRGHGIAAALLNAAMERLAARGHPIVSVTFNTTNLLSRSFWSGLGFAPVGWKLARRIPQRYVHK